MGSESAAFRSMGTKPAVSNVRVSLDPSKYAVDFNPPARAMKEDSLSPSMRIAYAPGYLTSPLITTNLGKENFGLNFIVTWSKSWRKKSWSESTSQ